MALTEVGALRFRRRSIGCFVLGDNHETRIRETESIHRFQTRSGISANMFTQSTHFAYISRSVTFCPPLFGSRIESATSKLFPSSSGHHLEAEQAIQPPTRRGRRLFWGFLALIVALPIIALLIWYLVAAFGRGPYYNMDSQEVFASHLLVLQEKDHLLNVESNDPAVVQSWFRSRLDFVPPACDLAAAGFALAGGRLDFMHDRAVGRARLSA